MGNLTFMLDLEAVGIFGPPFKPNNAGNVMRTKSDAGCYPAAESSLSPPMGVNPEVPEPSSGIRFQCSLVHIPYADISLPYACRVSKCRCCSRGPVPDVLICTVSFFARRIRPYTLSIIFQCNKQKNVPTTTWPPFHSILFS